MEHEENPQQPETTPKSTKDWIAYCQKHTLYDGLNAEIQALLGRYHTRKDIDEDGKPKARRISRGWFDSFNRSFKHPLSEEELDLFKRNYEREKLVHMLEEAKKRIANQADDASQEGQR